MNKDIIKSSDFDDYIHDEHLVININGTKRITRHTEGIQLPNGCTELKSTYLVTSIGKIIAIGDHLHEAIKEYNKL